MHVFENDACIEAKTKEISLGNENRFNRFLKRKETIKEKTELVQKKNEGN